MRQNEPEYSISPSKVTNKLTSDLPCKNRKRHKHWKANSGKTTTQTDVDLLCKKKVIFFWCCLLVFLLIESGSCTILVTLTILASPFSSPPTFLRSSSNRLVKRNGPAREQKCELKFRCSMLQRLQWTESLFHFAPQHICYFIVPPNRTAHYNIRKTQEGLGIRAKSPILIAKLERESTKIRCFMTTPLRKAMAVFP